MSFAIRVKRPATAIDMRHIQAYIDAYMRRVAVFIPEELLAGLKALKAEHGTPEAESIRRAIAAYLAEKGVRAKAVRKARDPKRKRA